ncbi:MULTISPECIES: FtsB family cell division protein [Bosea]|uniref:Cell division protein FtsB n=1 Tax=Bosea psychrotolerans TaxID=1871628 RepID=A0A2S4MKC5_9HYPH|nr:MULTISPECIES: septum formation initiator family protein [Bosea]POR55190.1 cell division protein FtsB [Bosea psychrotolerans]WNJ93448.1 septum formation initiator family protein [Bosea sp. 685]
MVIRRGVRSVLVTLALYLVSGAVVSYFLFHAQHGARGLEARDTLQGTLRGMEAELAALTVERKSWEQRLSLVRDEAVDRDLLEEMARSTLGRVHKNDVILMGR